MTDNDHLDDDIHHAATVRELQKLMGTEPEEKNPKKKGGLKITYECPECGALLSLMPHLRACPVCERLLTDDDLAVEQLLTEEDIRAEDDPESRQE